VIMMSILRLDYQRSMKPFPWGGVVLLVLSLVVLVLTGAYYRELSDNADRWEAKAGQIERVSQRQLLVSRSDARAPVDIVLEVRHANEVLRQLSLPWDGLFQAVESAGSKDVSLLALEPDMEKRLVKISGEAKNIAAMLNYIQQLEKCNVFGTVYLQSHQVQQQDPDKPVRFALLAVWRGRL